MNLVKGTHHMTDNSYEVTIEELTNELEELLNKNDRLMEYIEKGLVSYDDAKEYLASLIAFRDYLYELSFILTDN
jgi:hypothetical protein